MAGRDELYSFDGITASDLAQYVPVKAVAGATGRYIQVAAANTDDLVGVSLASAATYGYPVPVQQFGIAKLLFAASCGFGTRVGVASSNGAVGPLVASGQLASAGPSAGIFPARYSIGWANEPAAAGGIYQVVMDPRQIV